MKTNATLNYDKIISDLIKFNKEHRDEYIDLGLFKDSWKFGKEFQTIKIGGYRQSGLDNWIKDNADPNTIIIVVNTVCRNAMVDYFTRHKNFVPVICTARDVLHAYKAKELCKFNNISKIILDDAGEIRMTLHPEIMYKWFQDSISDKTDYIFIN